MSPRLWVPSLMGHTRQWVLLPVDHTRQWVPSSMGPLTRGSPHPWVLFVRISFPWVAFTHGSPSPMGPLARGLCFAHGIPHPWIPSSVGPLTRWSFWLWVVLAHGILHPWVPSSVCPLTHGSSHPWILLFLGRGHPWDPVVRGCPHPWVSHGSGCKLVPGSATNGLLHVSHRGCESPPGSRRGEDKPTQRSNWPLTDIVPSWQRGTRG